jgi:hypothetical protein
MKVRIQNQSVTLLSVVPKRINCPKFWPYGSLECDAESDREIAIDFRLISSVGKHGEILFAMMTLIALLKRDLCSGTS